MALCEWRAPRVWRVESCRCCRIARTLIIARPSEHVINAETINESSPRERALIVACVSCRYGAFFRCRCNRFSQHKMRVINDTTRRTGGLGFPSVIILLGHVRSVSVDGSRAWMHGPTGFRNVRFP